MVEGGEGGSTITAVASASETKVFDFWGVANALADSVKKTTADISARFATQQILVPREWCPYSQGIRELHPHQSPRGPFMPSTLYTLCNYTLQGGQQDMLICVGFWYIFERPWLPIESSQYRGCQEGRGVGHLYSYPRSIR
jgi:hypothetical protein